MRLFYTLWLEIIGKPSADHHLLPLKQLGDRIHLSNRIPVAALHVHIQVDFPGTAGSPYCLCRPPEIYRLVQINGNNLRQLSLI